jgi:hypothetical protein
MRAKQNPLLIQINDLKKVVEGAENFSMKRMLLVFNNTESRLRAIPGINSKYHEELEQITSDCLTLLDTTPQISFESYKSRLTDLLQNILDEASKPLFVI